MHRRDDDDGDTDQDFEGSWIDDSAPNGGFEQPSPWFNWISFWVPLWLGGIENNLALK